MSTNTKLAEALQDGLSVCNSVSMAAGRRVVIDGCVLYAQTEEWCQWAKKEVRPRLQTALNAHDAEQSAKAVPAAWKPAPVYRGYALLGTGRYLLDSTDAPADPELGAELIISIASEKDREGREIGERRDMPARTIQPDDMAVRIGFANERGLFALEDQLWMLRQEHWPGTKSAAMLAAAPTPPAPEAQQADTLAQMASEPVTVEMLRAGAAEWLKHGEQQAKYPLAQGFESDGICPLQRIEYSRATHVYRAMRAVALAAAKAQPEAQPPSSGVSGAQKAAGQDQDERAAFEAWAATYSTFPLDRDDYPRLGTTSYTAMEQAMLWDAWQARAALAQRREPLTDGQIVAAANEAFDTTIDLDDETLVNKYGHGIYISRYLDFARAIEAAHGIGATTGEQR